MALHDRDLTAADLLDHVVARLEAKYRPRAPIRVYVIDPGGECRLDLQEISIRLDQLIDELPPSLAE